MFNTEPNKIELRNFALVTGTGLALIFGLFIPWIWSFDWLVWPWYTAAVLVAWGLIHPSSLKPVYIGWMRFASVLAFINTRIILGLIFFLIFLPMALTIRLFGSDAMHRKFDPNRSSYRNSSAERKREDMEKPF